VRRVGARLRMGIKQPAGRGLAVHSAWLGIGVRRESQQRDWHGPAFPKTVSHFDHSPSVASPVGLLQFLHRFGCAVMTGFGERFGRELLDLGTKGDLLHWAPRVSDLGREVL
jgi:hypothetical protein